MNDRPNTAAKAGPARRPPSLRLPARARWTLRALTVLPPLCLLLASSVYSVSLFRLLRAHLVPIAEAELTRQTGHEVRIGRADFRRNGLVLTDIAISNKATFAAGGGEATLAARRLTVAYNLRRLLTDPADAASAIGDITLDSPTLLVERLANSQFNFSDLLKPRSKTTTKPFVGRVLIHNGLLRFRDYEAPANVGARPALNTLSGVEGTIDLSSARTAYFDVRGRGGEGRLASLAVSGDVSRLVSGRYRGHVIAQDADAAYWTAYFKAFPQGKVTSGRADVDVTVAHLESKPAPGAPLDLSGRIAVQDATVALADRKVLRLPLQAITGAATFTGAGVSFDAHLALAGQPLAASGTLFDFAHPQVAVSASSAGLDPSRLARAVPLAALPAGLVVTPGPVSATLTGDLTDPTATVNASLPAVSYGGNRLTGLQTAAVYANKILSVPFLTGRLNGAGAVALRATVDLTKAKPVVLAAGSLRGVNLAALRLPPNVSVKSLSALNLGGVADAQFLADNQNRPLSVVANVSVADLRVRQTTLRSVAGRVAWTLGQPVNLTRVVAQDPNGTLAVSGTVPGGTKSGRWNLTVRTAGLDLGNLLRPYTRAIPSLSGPGLAPDGRADFDGKVVGPAAAPQVVGAMRLIQPRLGRFSADLVTGRVAASVQALILQDVTLRRFPTEARVSGTVASLAGGNPALNLRLQLSQGDVQDFLHLAESASAPAPATTKTLTAALPNLSGVAEGTFEVTGRLKSPLVAGHATVTDATVADYRIDQADADLRYENGSLRVENGLVKSEGATLTAHGTRAASGVISADFAATGLKLDRFAPLLDPYADVTGTVSVAGRFGGTPRSPHVAIRALDSPDFVVDRQHFAPFSLAGRYDDGVLTQTGSPWRFLVSIPTDYAAEAGGQVEYDVNALRLSLPTPDDPRRTPTLALSAAIPPSSPERLSHVLGTVRGSRFGRTPAGQKFLASLDRLPQPLAGTFALPRFSVSGPLSALSASADLSASGLLLGETRLAGLTAALGYVGGPHPSGRVSAQAKDLLAGGVPVGAATLEADYKNRVVSVRQLRATSARAFLNASGTADLDGDVAATLDASNVPLSLLGTAVPAAAPFLRALPREISALSVSASGPTRDPDLAASVSLSNPPTPAPGGEASPAYALDRLRSGAITLASPSPGAPKILTVSDLAAFKNGRLVATLSGTLPIPRAAPGGGRALLPDQDLHADLAVQDLSALAAFSPGLLDPKKTAGRLSASVNFGGGRLSGLVTVSDGALGLTAFDTAVNKMNGIVVLGDNRATIQSFGGQSSKGGGFALSGSGDLARDGRVDLRLAANDLKVEESSKQNLLYQKFSSGLTAKINGVLTVAGPLLSPTIATPPGSPIVVSDATGTLPSPSPAGAAGGGPPAFDPFFNIAIQVGGGRSKTVSVRSALLSADAGGGVRLAGRLSSPDLRVHLLVAKGQFILPPTTRLRIVRPAGGGANTVDAVYGGATGPDGLPGLQTRVDLTAETNISVSPAAIAQNRSVTSEAAVGEAAPQSLATSSGSLFGGNGTQRYTITVHVLGTLNDPDHLTLDLTSSPGGLNRQQMLAALVPAGTLVAAVSGGGQGALENQFKNALGQVVLPTLISPLTTIIGNALDVDSLDVQYQPNQPLFVTVFKQIGPRLGVTFLSSFGARGAVDTTLQPAQYQLKVGYTLTRRLQFDVSTDDQRNNTVSLESQFLF